MTQYKNNIAPVTYGSGSGKVGVYYNYCAATAGTFCCDEMDYCNDSDDSVYDVCPSGWKMPTAFSNGDYYGTNKISISTPLSGYYYSSQSQLGSIGWFWSRNHGGVENYGVREMLCVSTRSYIYNGGEAIFDRASGASVRCILAE